MKQLFLTSSINTVAQDIAKSLDLSVRNKLIFITTAADGEEGDKTWLNNDHQALIDAGFLVSDYTIAGKTRVQLERDLEFYDFIYVSGGNTAFLLYHAQISGFISVIRDLILEKGKIYIGTSAGSIIAGPSIPEYIVRENPDIKLQDTKGFGFVNFTIIPHWGSQDFKERYLGERLKTSYSKNQVPLIVLTDSQYVLGEDNSFQIFDTLVS